MYPCSAGFQTDSCLVPVLDLVRLALAYSQSSWVVMVHRCIAGHWGKRVVEGVAFGDSEAGYHRSTAGMIDLVRIEESVEEIEGAGVDSRMVAGVHTEKRAVEERVPCCSISRGRGGFALGKEGSFDPLQNREKALK